MPVASLVRMANQIAMNFCQRAPEEAATEVATHIRSFWAPSMRADLFAYAEGGGAGLDPLVIAALNLIRTPAGS